MKGQKQRVVPITMGQHQGPTGFPKDKNNKNDHVKLKHGQGNSNNFK